MNFYYTNPVYGQYMADPFVLSHEGHYYAYGTAAPAGNGLQFPVLHSTDLVAWHHQGWSLKPAPGAVEYWAPEVTYHAGRFYMYYSARMQGQDHQLRVAFSRYPAGPFEDSGQVLLPDDPFTIDAHPFRDADGQWYLFYARDFLDSAGQYRAGTGIVVDRLVDMTTLGGEPRVVVRPDSDWQLFLPQRAMYGGVYDWHTVEGPALRVHNGRYYCFYSGGAWERDNYGVSYVVADHPLGPYTRPNDLHEPILRSVPGRVIGPGHNSFVRVSGGQEYMIYHAWDAAMTARLMRLDRLLWENGRPLIDGPTWTAQPAPAIP